MMSELWTEKHVKGNSCGLIYGIIPPFVCSEWVRKTTKPLSQYSLSLGQQLKSELHDHEAGMLTIQTKCSVENNYEVWNSLMLT
jgi:hypothetical protein